MNNDIELDFGADYATDFVLYGINESPTETVARMYPSTLFWRDTGTSVQISFRLLERTSMNTSKKAASNANYGFYCEKDME